MYTEFFGFTDKPFDVTPDPRFLYLSPSHQEALASMIYGIRERRGFVSIIGEVGTGKTTLLHTLFNELDKKINTVFIFNTRINFNQLLQNILIELELNPKSTNKSELLYQLNDFLIEKLSLGENVALIIDEAQNLSSAVLEELRMLSNLETDKEKLIQIILVGQPELDFKLRSPNLRQLKQRIGINCYLTPLNHKECMNYISHRLYVVASDNSVFTPEALKLICEFSHGIPRLINIICDNALVTGYGKGERIIDHAIVKEVIADFNGKIARPTTKKTISDSLQKTNLFKSKSFNLIFSLSIILLAFTLLSLFILYLQPTFFNNLYNKVFHPEKLEIAGQYKSSKSSSNTSSINKTLKKVETSQASLPASKDSLIENLVEEKNNHLLSKSKVAPLVNSLISANIKNVIHTGIGKDNYTFVIAKDGDILSKIVYNEYGIINDTIYEIVKSANPEIQDIDQIKIGQKIILPKIDIDSQIVEIAPNVYSFHITSFRSYSKVKNYLSKLMDNNYPIYVLPVKGVGEKTWYRIMIGQFSNRDNAIEFAKSTIIR